MKNVGEIMSRTLYNATVIPEIIELIAREYNLAEKEAMKLFYESFTAKALNSSETGLYGQSALYIYSLYKMEKEEA